MEAEDLGATETNHKSLGYVREGERVVRFNTNIQSQEARHQMAHTIMMDSQTFVHKRYPLTM